MTSAMSSRFNGASSPNRFLGRSVSHQKPKHKYQSKADDEKSDSEHVAGGWNAMNTLWKTKRIAKEIKEKRG